MGTFTRWLFSPGPVHRNFLRSWGLFMRSFFTAAAAATVVALTHSASSGGSFAADVAAPPLKAAPPLSPPWTGFYVGATGGYGWKHDNFTRTTVLTSPLAPMTIDGIDSHGGVFGGYAGHN